MQAGVVSEYICRPYRTMEPRGILQCTFPKAEAEKGSESPRALFIMNRIVQRGVLFTTHDTRKGPIPVKASFLIGTGQPEEIVRPGSFSLIQGHIPGFCALQRSRD